MYIEFIRSGGFAGIRLTGSFDTQKLPPEQASTLEELINDAGFFDLPTKIKPPSPGPDQFEYRVSISSNVQKHSVVVDESVIPDRLRPLLSYLTTLTTLTTSSNKK